MSRLFVVRHGQARFLTEDYDRLSELGVEQSATLGRAWRDDGLRFERAWQGSLQRQQATADAVADAFEGDFPSRETLYGLDEYPAEALIDTLVPVLRADDPEIDAAAAALQGDDALTDRERYRQVHRLLEAVMRAWVGGDYPRAEVELPSWHDFSGGVRDALARIMAGAPRGADVAVFTSGGPVGIAVQTALGAPELAAAELNWRVYNASVTQFTFSGRRVSLDGFNLVGHLPRSHRTYR